MIAASAALVAIAAALVAIAGDPTGDEVALSEHVARMLLCVLLIGPPWYAAVVWRRILLPDWRGPLARVAEAVAVTFALLLVAKLLGLVDLLRIVPLISVLAFGSGAAVALAPSPPRAGSISGAPAHEGRLLAGLALGAAAAAVLAHVVEAASILGDGGIVEYDSLWYHLPVAADFVQEHSVRGLTDVGNPPSSFYPFDAELVHALGIAALGHDAFSGLVNVLWLVLALAAGWAIGLPFGRPWLALLGVSTVAVTQILLYSSAATANSDLMALAFVLAAAAFVLNARGAPWPILLACLAAGVVLGAKLPMAPTAVALIVVAIVALPRGQRLRWGKWGLLCVFLAGSFWYIRNAFHADNPVPWMGVDLGLFSLPSLGVDPTDCSLTSVASWLDDGSVVTERLRPQLDYWLGALWPIFVGVSTLGAAGAAVFGRQPALRMLGGVALFGWLAYLVTPATGGEADVGTDNPSCFGYNLRFALAPMTLGTVAALLAIPRKLSALTGIATAALLLVTMLTNNAIDPAPAIVVGVVAGLLAPQLGRRRWRVGYVPLGAAVAAIVLLTLPLVNRYLDTRYRDAQFYDTALREAATWARDVEDAEVAVGGGRPVLYPLYGLRVTNSPSFVSRPDPAERFERPRTCDEWRRALTVGGYDYVVTTPATVQEPPPREAAWTRDDERAEEILASGPLTIFAFDASRQPDPC